ncbi:MAG: hypothetical protein WKG07_35965 [Hymenobacter sp.]
MQSAQAAIEQAQAAPGQDQEPPAPTTSRSLRKGSNQAQANLEKLANPGLPRTCRQRPASGRPGADQPGQAPQAERLRRPGRPAVRRPGPGLPDKLLSANRYDLQTAQASLNQALANLALEAEQRHLRGRGYRPGRRRPGAGAAEAGRRQPGRRRAHRPLQRRRRRPRRAAAWASKSASASPSSRWWIRARCGWTWWWTRRDVAKVQPGQPVTLTFEALTGQRIPGAVLVVAPTATVQSGVVNYLRADPGRSRPGTGHPARHDGHGGHRQRQQGGRPSWRRPCSIRHLQGRARTVEVMDAEGKTTTRPVQTGLDQRAGDRDHQRPAAGRPRRDPRSTTTATARVPGFGGGAPGAGGPGGGGPGPAPVIQASLVASAASAP